MFIELWLQYRLSKYILYSKHETPGDDANESFELPHDAQNYETTIAYDPIIVGSPDVNEL